MLLGLFKFVSAAPSLLDIIIELPNSTRRAISFFPLCQSKACACSGSCVGAVQARRQMQ